MPRIMIKEICGYIGGKEYYCPNCGVELGFNAHIDLLLMDDEIEKLSESSFFYCNKCGEKIG